MRISDWSSDVCSSDLKNLRAQAVRGVEFRHVKVRQPNLEPGVGVRRAAHATSVAVADLAHRAAEQLGRASCRESEGQYVYISVVAVSIKNKSTEATY